MTELREQSRPSEASASPTLKPGRRYLSIIAHVSGENAQRLEEWKQKTTGIPVASMSTHVTVYVAELDDFLLDTVCSPRFSEDLGASRLEARWGSVQSFRPVTEVDYLDLEAGKAEFEWIHQKLVQMLGTGAAPFPYVQVANAREVFDALPAEQRTFSVDYLHCYSYDGQNWEEIGVLPLR